MKLILAVAAAFNLLSAAAYALTAARIHQKAYLQGRKDEENWWIAIEGAVEQEQQKIWKEEE